MRSKGHVVEINTKLFQYEGIDPGDDSMDITVYAALLDIDKISWFSETSSFDAERALAVDCLSKYSEYFANEK